MHCEFWLKLQATNTRFLNLLSTLDSMAPSQSKLGLMLWQPQDLPLDEILYFQDCCDVLVFQETAEHPEDYTNTSNLFQKYIHQEMQRMTGQEVWLCCMSYNYSEGTAWPCLTEVFVE